MIDEIKKKVKGNPLCDLSIEELIILSKLDCSLIADLFGKNFVARIPQ